MSSYAEVERDTRGFEANVAPMAALVDAEVSEAKGSAAQLAAVMPRTKEFAKCIELLAAGTKLADRSNESTSTLTALMQEA